MSCGILDPEGGNPNYEFYHIDRIYSINLDGRDLKMITIGSDYSLLPNGKIIYINNKKLYSCESDGSENIIISPINMEIHNYQIYLNGTKLFFINHYYMNSSYYSMNLDGSEFTQLELPNNLNLSSSIKFSPDGRRIAYVNKSRLFIINSDGSNPILVKDSTNRSYCYNLNFTPDGNNLIYIYDIQYGEALDLRLFNINEMADTSLFYNNMGNSVITYTISKWNTLLFSNSDGINLENLNNYTHNFLYRGGDPYFSFDSTKITFMNYDFKAICVMDINQKSTTLINVNLPNNVILHPLLSLDSKRVFFQADTSWYVFNKQNSNKL